MEDTVSSSMGAMGPVLRKLDLLLASESRLRKRVKDGIGLLKQDLEEVSSALVDLSMLETPSLRAKCWMEEARELSYHVEDFVDELMLMRTDAGAKIRAISRHRVGRVKIPLLPAPPRRSTRIAKIAQLRDLMSQANQRLERYQLELLDDCCSSPNHTNMITQHRRAPPLYGDAANLVGIKDSRTSVGRARDGAIKSASSNFLPGKMEDTVSSSMGGMGSVLRKLDLLLASESRLRKRVKDGIGLLKQDLEEVSSALVDLSMLETPSLRAKCWMEEARDLFYHVEDFVDELALMCTDAGAKIRAVSRHRVGRVKIPLLPAPPRRSTRIAKIAQLRDLLSQANQRLERYQLDDCCSSPNHTNMITQHRRALPLYGDVANLVGIKDSRTKLIEMLTGEAEQQLKVVSIVGPAGVGKTTLAKEIFRELRGQFELRAFVHASRKIDMRRLLGSIQTQVQPHHQLPSVAGTVQSLIDSIQEQLRDKRYLIVIDDLWEETAWDTVRSAFPEGNNCSRIVATTENMNAALKCCSYMADNILKMKPLGNEDSGYLFFNRVFGSEQQCPDELKEVSYGIIKNCCGLPLSLIHVAGLLASIDYSELWYYVHDHLCSIVNTSHTVKEIQKKILNLSYKSLPPCLKTCLLYFNMYPEGCIMWKVHLAKQWIAEGFINAAEGKDREEIAEGYFEELVNRGMVQPMKIDYNDKVLSCTVHHIIFDLINHNSKEEEFISAIDYSQPITGHSTKAHRLSFRFSSAKYARLPARITMSQLRSLAFFGFLKCMPPVVEFKHLRVLVLDFWGSHDGHKSLDFSRICILFQLRYLKISGDIMVELPAQMQGLHYLETLEIDAKLSAVPLDIVHLPSLLHLGLRAATKLPDGIGHIKSLSTLLYFDLRCNSEDNIRSLSKLTNLQHLHLTCSAALSSDHLKRKLEALVFSLGKFGNLKSLTLTPDALRTAVFFDIWSGISSPPMFLQKLELLPPICFFHRLPSRIGELHKLCILKIVVKELQGNDISNISGLPSLVVFSLYVRTALTGTIVFSTMAFPALKYFKFTCGVMCLDFQAGAMPNLQMLKLCFNAYRGKNHSQMLDGIEHLLNLQEVTGRIGVLPGADESDWRVVKLLFEDTIRKHQRCPRFNSQCPRFNSQLVDLIEEEYPPSDKFRLTRHEGSSSEQKNIEKACAEDEYSKHHMLVSILRDESAEPTTLDLSLLEDITNNFSTEQEIDQGGFGMVYKGILGDGVVAVKRLCGQYETVHGESTHVVDCLMTVKHSNIVRFLGYWAHMQPSLIEKEGESLRIEQQDMLLCFEYLRNGSLRRHITDESCGFEWHTRYQIMKGIFQGLDYLHENHVIHLHLKPENILLDASMVPKIADYAYARLLGRDRRTATQEIFALLDYLAPEYFTGGAISVKSDIYSLGVIIMQMVTGHKDCPNIESVLGGWRNRLESDTSQRHIALETAYRQVILCIELGKSCMHRDPTKRPCIRDIIDRLAEMEASEESSVTSGTSSVPKFRLSGDESEASLITPSPTSGKDSLNHHQEIKKSTDEAAWNKGRRICGTVVLVIQSSHHDSIKRILRPRFHFLLVSATEADPRNGGKGTVGKRARLEEEVVSLKSKMNGETVFPVNFEWDKSQGIPGAILVKNLQWAEFFFKTLTLEGVPGKGTVVFVANSWIYPHHQERIFFTNDTYLPSKMPAALVPYRQDELKILRGDDNPGPYFEYDRVYCYDYYNDLGEPDKGEDHARPNLGGNQEHPYPRRCKTGRHPTKKAFYAYPNSERRRPFLLDPNIYVPCDEQVGHLKKSDALGYSLKAITEAALPTLGFIDDTLKEFDSFEDILRLYDLGPEAPNNPLLAEFRKKIPSEFLISRLGDGSHNHPLKMPLPNIIKSDVLKKAPEFKFGWRTDEEFARETLAGVNPVIIKRLTEFPARSTLDPSQYGDHTSKITEAHIQHNLEGLPLQNALKNNRLFILDHHDHFMPYLNKINKLEGNFIYASRTLLFLKDDGTLKPLAIELSLPHPDGQQHGAVSKVYTPAHTSVEGHIWQLAKAYACVNDSAWHQLISHWLNTHAVIEPFIIATNRQLSVVHPVHKLLRPHYRDTLNINALACQTLINADGIFERTMFPAKYALGMSSDVYKSWNFNEQALPADLVKRGVAVPDKSSPYGVRLLIKDYPYAVDGLVIWWAIERWVKEYLDVYYSNDGELQHDVEVQAWWKEVREEAHGDLKDRDWWPRMDTVQQLARTCTTIIWVASAQHAAVNFGQYPYAGYLPNRPTVSRQPMPEPGSRDYAMLEAGQEEADKVFIRTFTSQFQTILGISLIEILSKHSSDEVYLGQRDEPELWTSDAKVLDAFKRFGSRLVEIENRIVEMNDNPALKNRKGPVGMPYMLLYPNTSDVTGEKGEGLTAMGIPNSISI